MKFVTKFFILLAASSFSLLIKPAEILEKYSISSPDTPIFQGYN